MADFDLPVVKYLLADNFEEAIQAAAQIGYPLVMKTAEPGITHKSDCGGVIIDIQDLRSLEQAYADLQNRLGCKVVIMPMVSAGIEVSLGMKNDPHYGPVIIVACGGVLIELIKDRTFALAPLNTEQAMQMLAGLKLSQLLDGIRGQAAVNRQALIDLIVRFSELAVALSQSIREIDLNPVIVSEQGCTIVDALIVPKSINENNT